MNMTSSVQTPDDQLEIIRRALGPLEKRLGGSCALRSCAFDLWEALPKRGLPEGMLLEELMASMVSRVLERPEVDNPVDYMRGIIKSVTRGGYCQGKAKPLPKAKDPTTLARLVIPGQEEEKSKFGLDPKVGLAQMQDTLAQSAKEITPDCRDRIEAIRRYEHRHCTSPCYPGCPQPADASLPRPHWAYLGYESPEAFQRTAKRPAADEPVAKRYGRASIAELYGRKPLQPSIPGLDKPDPKDR